MGYNSKDSFSCCRSQFPPAAERQTYAKLLAPSCSCLQPRVTSACHEALSDFTASHLFKCYSFCYQKKKKKSTRRSARRLREAALKLRVKAHSNFSPLRNAPLLLSEMFDPIAPGPRGESFLVCAPPYIGSLFLLNNSPRSQARYRPPLPHGTETDH